MLGLSATQVVAYVAALGLAAAIPGPGMTALVARSVSSGAPAGFAMLAGLMLGDLTYLSLAVFGLSLVAQTHAALIVWINWAAAAYLALLAAQFWRHRPQAITLGQKPTPRALVAAWLAGLGLTLGNPKTMAFYLAILPLLLPLESISIRLWALVLAPLTIGVLFTVGGGFILAAVKVRHWLTSPRAQQYLFRTAAAIMGLTALGMVSKTL